MSIFNTTPLPKIKRSTHNESHQVKLSFDAGTLYPIMTELCLPGDTWKVRLEQFIRTMPMIAPVLDRIDVKVDAFFVPLRLIWDDFEDFITLGTTGEFTAYAPRIVLQSSSPTQQYVNLANPIVGIGGLSDYLNFPTNHIPVIGQPFDRVMDALPFRAYQFIYNEYYRNQDLEDEIPVNRSSGPMVIISSGSPEAQYSNFYLQQRGWRKDYFTSALPRPQKGPAVRIPTGDIVADGVFKLHGAGTTNSISNQVTITGQDPVTGVGDVHLNWRPGGGSTMQYESGLKSELPTIEELRYAECLQEYYEANARGGTRPKEYYLNIWRTRTKDARLDRPEWLGGYRGPVTISDIDQTSQSDISAQGTLAGKGMSAGGSKLFKYHSSEWGIIMCIMSVTPKSAYYQGTRRWNLYDDVFDWPNPYFANLGEQEVYKDEIYDDPATNGQTFGYTARYAECKFIPDSVHGQFRTTLNYWHLARQFNSAPNLNKNFVHVQPSDVARIFPNQVMNNDKFLGTFFFHVQRNMGLPYYGIPRLLHSI